MKSENDIEKKQQSNTVQGHTQGSMHSGLQGMTGAYSGTQGMYTAANRGSQGVQGLCSGADRVCTVEDKGFSHEQRFLQPVV